MADPDDLKPLSLAGSSPALSTKFCGVVAQLAEQRPFKPKRVGSLPSGSTILFPLSVRAAQHSLKVCELVQIQ